MTLTLASGGTDRAVVLWDPITGKEIRSLDGSGAQAWTVAFSPDGKYLGAGAEESVCLLDSTSSRALRHISADGSVIYLYHPQVLVALTEKVDGYKQMPDGLLRVVGVKLK